MPESLIAELTTDNWTEAMAVATIVMALPTVWGSFVLIRGSCRKVALRWRQFINRIGKEAVDAHEEQRLIEEGLRKAAKEAEERRLDHAKRDAMQEQHSRMLLDLKTELKDQTILLTETFNSKMDEHEAKDVERQRQGRQELADGLKTVIAQIKTNGNGNHS